MSTKTRCQWCRKRHHSKLARLRCERNNSSKKYTIQKDTIEMEQCPVCDAYQEEPSKLESFVCKSCGVVAI